MPAADEERRNPWWLWVTRAGVVAVVVVIGRWLLQPPADVCRQTVAQTHVVKVCNPVEMTDPRIGLALLIIGLLLLPELSELELFGVKLRRQVQEAKQDAAAAKVETAQLRQQLTQLSLAQSSASSGVVNQVTVTTERAGATGATLVTAANDGIAVPVLEAEARAEEVSEAAVIAFTAAMFGLGHSLPPWCENPAAIGLLLEDGHMVATHNPLGVQDSLIDVATSLFDPADPDSTGFAVANGSWVCMAPAYVGEDLLGGLAVVFDAPDLDRALAAGLEPDDLRIEVTATTGSLAAAYAQLLVDLLGEVPAGREEGDRAQ